MRVSLICIFSVVLFVSCGDRSSSVESADVVAKVNHTSIKASDLSRAIERMSSMPTQDYSSNEKKRELLNEMIDQELLVQAAIDEKVYETSDNLRNQISLEYLKQKLGPQHDIPTDDEIQAFFQKNRGTLEKVKASHILIKPEKPGDASSEAAARKKAEGLRAQIVAGANFGTVAQKNSQDEANRATGGDLGLFDRKKMDPTFTEAAFALKKVGDISPVVKTPFGYHIIQLTADQRGLERFRHDIRWQIVNEKRRLKAQELFASLRKKASIKIYDDNIAKAAAKREEQSAH